MNVSFSACNANAAIGVLTDVFMYPVVFDCQTQGAASVSVSVVAGTWSSAVLSVKRGNTERGPWFALPTPVTMTSTSSTQCTIPVDLNARFLAVTLDTANGAELVLDVDAYMRSAPLSV